MVTILAINAILFKTIWEKWPNGKDIVDEAAHLLNEEFGNWKTSLRLPEANVKMIATIEKCNFQESKSMINTHLVWLGI